MFLDLNLGIKRKRAVLKELPAYTRTPWKPPTEFPDLRDASLLSFDVETKELEFEYGPGWGRGPAGHIVGFSVAALAKTGEQWKGYFPIRHEVEPHENLDAQPCLRWLKDMVQAPMPKTGANLIYDCGWLTEENIFVNGPLYDCQFAEALLDEAGPTNLEFLGHKYLKQGKQTDNLFAWIMRAYPGPVTAWRGNIWRAPPNLVGYYGEGDADMPLNILPMQWAEMSAQGLLPLFEMECRLIRLLIKMRRKGVHIDLNYAEKLYGELGGDFTRLKGEFDYKYGGNAGINQAAALGPIFENVGIKVPRTPTGQYSLTKDWLKAVGEEHDIGKEVIRLRELDKLRSTFVRGYMLERNVKGRLHCQFHPLRQTKSRGGTSGAKTGRLSSSDPNLQNIPVRTPEGKKIRKAFRPTPGTRRWRKYDYSQIEYRMTAHFAVDDGDGSAELLRASYRDNPDIDYHDYVYDAACPFMGWDVTDDLLRKDKRRPIKNTNFGLLYGQGQGKLARTMQLTPAQAKDFFTAYHTAAPYVKPTMEACAREVHSLGYVTTILGRRTRFDLWSPFTWDRDQEPPEPLPYQLALNQWGSNIERAYAYRAVNYKFQGSAADMMKRAMDLCDQSGVFDYIGCPLLTVHDELDFEEIDDTPAQVEAYAYMQHIMETAIPLRVPVRADPDFGPNWGECG